MKKYILLSMSAITLVSATTVFAMDKYNGFVYCPKIDRSLSYGNMDAKTNNSVSELHKFLDSYYGHSPAQELLGAGRYGYKTEAKVKAFQKENGLEGLGMVGPKTRALMKTKCTSAN